VADCPHRGRSDRSGGRFKALLDAEDALRKSYRDALRLDAESFGITIAAGQIQLAIAYWMKDGARAQGKRLALRRGVEGSENRAASAMMLELPRSFQSDELEHDSSNTHWGMFLSAVKGIWRCFETSQAFEALSNCQS